MSFFLYLLLFIFGLAAGSFINVITLRYQPAQKILDKKIIGGRSHCPICLKTLAWYELIPIFSFFIQRGRCRGCGHKISLQYPLVEILSGLIFVFVPLALTYNLQLMSYDSLRSLVVGYWLLVFVLLLLLSIIDLRHSIIPNQINLTLGVLGLILIIINSYNDRFNFLNGSFLGHYAVIFGLRENIWISYSVAALLGMAIFGAIILLSRGKAMGLGDFKFVAALGLIFGWPDILMVIFLAFIIGALVGIVFLIRKKKKMKDAIPFGPFLVIGAALTFFLGHQIIEGYFKLFGLY
jgi:prepilin signal peptidase PulO-like enzyme (type II secretory pathway)